VYAFHPLLLAVNPGSVLRLMTVSLVLMLAAQAYFLYKFCSLFISSRSAQYVTVRRSLAVFCAYQFPRLTRVMMIIDVHIPTVIISFIILFATFAVGLRCFADFDKGLRTPKTLGSYPLRTKSSPTNATPVDTGADLRRASKTVANDGTPMASPGLGGFGDNRTSSYMGGTPLQPRMSIE
jgi:hypothetical protein